MFIVRVSTIICVRRTRHLKELFFVFNYSFDLKLNSHDVKTKKESKAQCQNTQTFGKKNLES